MVLLFTDVVLPGGRSGLDLAQEVRRQQPDLKVLFTSGYTEHHLASFNHPQEGIELLGKPYRKSQLASKLHVMLDTGPPTEP